MLLCCPIRPPNSICTSACQGGAFVNSLSHQCLVNIHTISQFRHTLIYFIQIYNQYLTQLTSVYLPSVQLKENNEHCVITTNKHSPLRHIAAHTLAPDPPALSDPRWCRTARRRAPQDHSDDAPVNRLHPWQPHIHTNCVTSADSCASLNCSLCDFTPT